MLAELINLLYLLFLGSILTYSWGLTTEQTRGEVGTTATSRAWGDYTLQPGTGHRSSYGAATGRFDIELHSMYITIYAPSLASTTHGSQEICARRDFFVSQNASQQEHCWNMDMCPSDFFTTTQQFLTFWLVDVPR